MRLALRLCLHTAGLWLLTASTAEAAPVAAAIAGFFTSIGIGATTAAALAGALVRTVVSAALSKLAASLRKKPQPAGIRTEVTQTGGTSPMRFPVGLTASAGQFIAPPGSYGAAGKTPRAHLVYLVALSVIPGATLRRLVINDRYVQLAAAPGDSWGHAVEGNLAGVAAVDYKDGSQVVADADLLAAFGSDPDRPWTSDMIGRGLCWLKVRFKYSREHFNGLPSIRAEMMGIPLYDPRLDSTAGGAGPQRWNDSSTWTQTGNLAVIIYNIMRGIEIGPGLIWGGGYDADDLPTGPWFAAMNTCDVEVPRAGGGTRPQFWGGLEIALDDEPLSVVAELLKACTGEMAEVGGYWDIRVGPPRMPVLHVTDDDFLVTQEQEFDPFPSLLDTYNGITSTYPEPESLWEARDAPPRYNAEWEAEDGGRRLVADYPLPACSDGEQVQQVMDAVIADHRRFRRHRGVLPSEAAILSPLDSISWTSQRYGYTGKVFEVKAVVDSLMTLRQGLALREVDGGDFAWDIGKLLPSVPVGTPTTPPSAQAVPGFAVAAATIVDAETQARRPAIEMTWDAEGAEDARGLVWQLRLAGAGETSLTGSHGSFADGALRLASGILPATDYEVRAKLLVDRAVTWTAWLPVTTPDIRLGLVDLAPDVEGAMEDALAAAALAEAAEAGAQAAQTASETARNLSQAAATAAADARDAADDAAALAVASETAAAGSAVAAATAKTASEAAKTAAETARNQAQTHATNANASATAAAGSAATASTKATEAGNSAAAAEASVVEAEAARDDAQDAASASASSASAASTSATDAATEAAAAATARTQAETARGQAQTYAAQAAASETNAAGSANTATTQAGVAASALSDAQRALASASTVIAGKASTATLPFGASRTGTVDNYVVRPAAEYYADGDGVYLRRQTNAANNAVYLRGMVPSVDGNVYRVSAKVKPSAAMNAQLLMAFRGADDSDVFVGFSPTIALAAGVATTLTLVFGRQAGGLVTQVVGSLANWTNASGIRCGVKNLEAAGADTYLQVYEIRVDDLTQADKAARSADGAAGSASAAATSATTATTKATEAATSASAASTSATTASTKAGEASTSATNAANSASTATTKANEASASATVAATQAGNAGTSASAASGSATTAATKATEASNSATAAAASATTASTKASEAGTSASQATTAKNDAQSAAATATTQAGIAVSARDSALRTAASLGPYSFDQDGLFWTQNLGGEPVARMSSSLLSAVTFGTDSAEGRYAQIATPQSGNVHLAPKGYVPGVVGRRYRLTVRAAHIGAFAGNSDKALRFNMRRVTTAWSAVTDFASTGATFTAPDTWQTFTVEGVFSGSDPWFVPFAYINAADFGGASGRSIRISMIKCEDVTESYAAATSASAAGTSATNAAASATTAGQQATIATTKATEASTSAGTASTKAGEASSSASDAAGSANTAAIHAGAAAGSATTAGNHATAAAGSAATATTKAGEAGTYAAQALEYRNTAARLMSGGVSKNPVFSDWTGTYPAHVGCIPLGAGTITKVSSGVRYHHAIEIDATNTGANGPVVQLERSAHGLDCSLSPRAVLARMEIEYLSGDLPGSGSFLRGHWQDTAVRVVSRPLKDLITATPGVVQVVETYIERPADAVPASAANFALIFYGHSNTLGGTRAPLKVRIHRLDFEEVLAGSATETWQRAAVDFQGVQSAVVGFRAEAGSAGASVELVALDDPAGPALSGVTINGQYIRLNGDTVVDGDFEVTGSMIANGAVSARAWRQLSSDIFGVTNVQAAPYVLWPSFSYSPAAYETDDSPIPKCLNPCVLVYILRLFVVTTTAGVLTFRLQGSDDGSAWTDLTDSRYSWPASPANTAHTVVLRYIDISPAGGPGNIMKGATNAAYSHYRLVCWLDAAGKEVAFAAGGSITLEQISR